MMILAIILTLTSMIWQIDIHLRQRQPLFLSGSAIGLLVIARSWIAWLIRIRGEDSVVFLSICQTFEATVWEVDVSSGETHLFWVPFSDFYLLCYYMV